MDYATVLSQPGTVTGIGGGRGDQSEQRAFELHDSGTDLADGNDVSGPMRTVGTNSCGHSP
jgi:hypothetical protein